MRLTVVLIPRIVLQSVFSEKNEVFVFQFIFLVIYVIYVLLQLYLYCYIGERLLIEVNR